MRAYIVLKVEPQSTANFMQELKHEKPIVQASLIHGPYDCVVEVEADGLDMIHQVVMRLREMKGVIDTMTCIVIQSWQRTPM